MSPVRTASTTYGAPPPCPRRYWLYTCCSAEYRSKDGSTSFQPGSAYSQTQNGVVRVDTSSRGVFIVPHSFTCNDNAILDAGNTRSAAYSWNGLNGAIASSSRSTPEKYKQSAADMNEWETTFSTSCQAGGQLVGLLVGLLQ